jgi:lysophospholipase L1-like esterase
LIAGVAGATECCTNLTMATLKRSAGIAIAAALLALAVGAPARAAPGGSVLVVGDSLEELTSPYLPNLLPGVKLTVNAVGGTNTFEILELFEESYDPAQNVIVFDGGTNDNPNYPQILEENLAKVAATVGDRCMVVPTIHGYTVAGADNHGKNSVVHRFAASRPGTQTPDYASLVNHNPGLLQSDNLHPTEEGSERRAELIAQGILGCIAYEESLGVPAASLSAAPAEVKTTRLKPVGRLAKREASLYRAMATRVIRKATMLAVLRGLLPG